MNYHDAIYSADRREYGDLTWDSFSESFEDALRKLEEIVNAVSELRQIWEDELCEGAEFLLGDATVAAFAISEPHWTSDEETKKLRDLKKRIHDLYQDSKPLHN